MACGLLNCDTHVGSSFLTRDRNWAPCIGSADSYSLDQQSPTFLAPGTSSVEDNFSYFLISLAGLFNFIHLYREPTFGLFDPRYYISIFNFG